MLFVRYLNSIPASVIIKSPEFKIRFLLFLNDSTIQRFYTRISAVNLEISWLDMIRRKKRLLKNLRIPIAKNSLLQNQYKMRKRRFTPKRSKTNCFGVTLLFLILYWFCRREFFAIGILRFFRSLFFLRIMSSQEISRLTADILV